VQKVLNEFVEMTMCSEFCPCDEARFSLGGYDAMPDNYFALYGR
jgi:hypothetical protein